MLTSTFYVAHAETPSELKACSQGRHMMSREGKLMLSDVENLLIIELREGFIPFDKGM